MRIQLDLEPLDTLFFRDARPMQAGAGSGGHGARWPLPTVLHEALRAALLRRSGAELGPKSLPGHTRKDSSSPRTIVTRDYESLRIQGPFPARDGKVYFPIPADVVAVCEHQVELLAPVLRPPGHTNLTAPWLSPVAGRARASKTELPRWVPSDDFQRLIAGHGRQETPHGVELWHTEHRIGIAIDPTSGTAAEGKIYSAEHLRPVEGLRLRVQAELNPKDPALVRDGPGLEDLLNDHLTLGGESRLCRVVEADPLPEFTAPPTGTTRVKWVLVAPAVFRGGWLPEWVDREGQVQLRKGDTERRPGENRRAWRERVRALERIDARLVAVCCGKPVAFSGWDLATTSDGQTQPGAPKPTWLAVPAGSVYYFEAGSPDDGDVLVKALQGRTRSDFFGEKGMGLGFCAGWWPLEVEFAR